MIYLNLASLILSVVALAVAIATYLLNRKAPNENKLFDEKIRCYHIVIKAMNDTTGIIFSCIGEYGKLKEEKAGNIDEKADEMNDDIDEVFNNLEDIIAENTLVLPNDILELLYEFLDVINKEEYLDTYLKQAKKDELNEQFNDAFEKVVVAMQDDLGFEKLDGGLKRRTGGRSISHINEAE